ncbi:MAG: sugar transferase [Bacteroidales bacterium]|nr:sugar transferase [Bacteroidales bacterium]
MYRNCLKRCISLLLSLLALLAVSWLIGLVAVVLYFANKGAGVFFLQPRPGRDAKIFKVIKFKTMTNERDDDGKLLPDAQRLTGVGKIVRSLSLDELPQLVNILKGDMAFIGPRPWRVEYLPLYSPQQMRRHEVRPGITGWAQVHGRNAISFTKRLEYDIYYVDHLSFWLDARIFFMTIRKVLRREGISEAGQATSEAFNGHN